MSDLNLNFDTGVKSVTMGGSSGDNISIKQDDNGSMDSLQPPTQPTQTDPTLSVSDPVGIEFLAKGSNSPIQSAENTPKSNKEEFSFFKPTEEPKVEEVPQKSDTDDMLVNPKQSDSSEFKPIHRLTPQDIKNEKIDLLYKFKKLESQGIRTTMNYNMNSNLEDMRNEYIKLKNRGRLIIVLNFSVKC